MYNTADTRRLQTALLSSRVMNAQPVHVQVNCDQISRSQNQLVWSLTGRDSNAPKQLETTAQKAGNGNGFNRFALSSAIVLSSAVCLWILLFLLVGAFYLNISSTTSAFKQELRPQLEQALQHMGSVLDHMDKAATSADHMLAEADSLEHSILPAVVNAVNDSAAVLHKLEGIAQNPVFKLSLG